jgi:hypothetical protein
MATTQAQSYAAGLFEKAQGGIAMLASIDAQIGELLSQRRDVQADLSQVQSLINDEFGRLMRESDELPVKVLAEISGNARGDNGHPEAVTRHAPSAVFQ